MTDLDADEAATLKAMTTAFRVAGDGDIAAGSRVLVGLLKIVRSTGESDPMKGVEKIEAAIRSAADIEKFGRFIKWLIVGVLAVLAMGAQAVDLVQKWAVILRGGGKLP